MALKIKDHEIGKGKPILCVPIMKTKKEEICQEARELVEKNTQMIEWRVDAFEKATDMNALREVLRELGEIMGNTLLVYTFRSKAQGGLLALPQDLVYDIHQIAAESGVVDFVDVEYYTSENPKKEIRTLQKMGIHVIVSHHDFDQTPEYGVMEMILSQMRESGADIVKLAVMPETKQNVLELLSVTERYVSEYPESPIITMSMGKLGLVSRVVGETFGSCVTFGAGTQASAPGQLKMADLEKVLSILHRGIGNEY